MAQDNIENIKTIVKQTHGLFYSTNNYGKLTMMRSVYERKCDRGTCTIGKNKQHPTNKEVNNKLMRSGVFNLTQLFDQRRDHRHLSKSLRLLPGTRRLRNQVLALTSIRHCQYVALFRMQVPLCSPFYLLCTFAYIQTVF